MSSISRLNAFLLSVKIRTNICQRKLILNGSFKCCNICVKVKLLQFFFCFHTCKGTIVLFSPLKCFSGLLFLPFFFLCFFVPFLYLAYLHMIDQSNMPQLSVLTGFLIPPPPKSAFVQLLA